MDCYINGEEGALQDLLYMTEMELFSEDHHQLFANCIAPFEDCFFLPDESCYGEQHQIPPPEFAGGELPCGSVSVEPPEPQEPQMSVGERKRKSRRVNGQPSKNLMAERRRRKRLNDRLSMLRSVVPKISKMDRTSILGDTIDYMKELMQKIKDLQQEMETTPDHPSFFKYEKPNEILLKNSPKFDVETRNSETRVEICCGGKEGLLLSTVTALEQDLGLEIQQCVASCFNDFALQASCFQDMGILRPEDIKQQLLRSVGYGGKCSI